jgi:hypothetical protein
MDPLDMVDELEDEKPDNDCTYRYLYSRRTRRSTYFLSNSFFRIFEFPTTSLALPAESETFKG